MAEGQVEYFGGYENIFLIDSGGKSHHMQLLAFIGLCTLNICK